MIAKLSQTLVLIASLVLPLASTSGQVYLTDITLFSADSQGNWVPPDICETRDHENDDIWIQRGALGGPFLNGPTSATAQPNISLPLGVSTFAFLTSPQDNVSPFGINLFFNGSVTPSISVYGPLLTTIGQQHTFAADGALHTAAANPTGYGQLFPGAGTLSFVSGNELITLTDYFYYAPSVYNVDLVGEITTGADGRNDNVGGITFTVTPIPEPQLLSWMIGMLAGIMAVRRGACHRQKR